MGILLSKKSDYRSDVLTSEDRQWLEKMLDCKRTDYYDLTPEQVDVVNEYTLENWELKLLAFDWATTCDRINLILVKPVEEPVLDDEGQPLVDEDGKPIVSHKMGEHKFTVDVVVEGLQDAEGTPIPKGRAYFNFTKEATNRPLVESNWKGNLLPRLPKFMLNGETMIKDSQGQGISEQHTCVARCVEILTGKVDPTDTRMMKFAIDGIHPLASITADTGKANTGKDIFGSDPEICPVDILETMHSRLGESDGKEFVGDQIDTRRKVCGATESVAKQLLLRLGGKNVNASLGASQHATELAHILTTRVMPNLDDLVAACEVFVTSIESKLRPVSVAECAVALACYQLRNSEPINTIHIDDKVGQSRDDLGVSLYDAPQFMFDVDEAYGFLSALFDSPASGPLAEYQSYRTHSANKRYKKEQKVGETLRAIQAFYAGEDITNTMLSISAKGIGKQTASKYHSAGGADRGPLPKLNKVDSDEGDSEAA